MASSLTTPNTPSERAAASVDAIAVLSADQAYQGRVLGVANPAPKGSTTTTAPVKSALKPASPTQGVETVAPEGSTTSTGTPIRLATDAEGNVVMTNGSSSVRNCLTSQTNTLAGRNSCVGPWFASMNASLYMGNVPRTNNRMSLSLNLSNPLGGIDQLLHGDDHLRGWGATPFMDGTLYQVRGFDATARRYIYQVNPRFGNTSPSASTLRSPFRMTLDVRMNLGHDAQEQDVILKMRVKPALKGTRASADTLKNRYMNSTSSNAFMDIYKLMLRYADSLALSRDQSEKVQARQKLLIARADSVFGGLAGYLAKLPESYSAKDAAKHVTDAATAMWDIIYAEGPWIKELLTPGQLRLLPGGLREMVTTPGFKGRFFYSLGP